MQCGQLSVDGQLAHWRLDKTWAFYPKYLQGITHISSGVSLGMHPANERRRYIVAKSHIGWAHI